MYPQKYTVYRKMPMMVTRSARMLTIDGGYIHVSRSSLSEPGLKGLVLTPTV